MQGVKVEGPPQEGELLESTHYSLPFLRLLGKQPAALMSQAGMAQANPANFLSMTKINPLLIRNCKCTPGSHFGGVWEKER